LSPQTWEAINHCIVKYSKKNHLRRAARSALTALS
jgi:hypothetical protein